VDADAVLDDVRDYVVEHLGDRNAVLTVDDTGSLKRGIRSAGVRRRYSGTEGRKQPKARWALSVARRSV
jgi:SRSO17 transposase